MRRLGIPEGEMEVGVSGVPGVGEADEVTGEAGDRGLVTALNTSSCGGEIKFRSIYTERVTNGHYFLDLYLFIQVSFR